MRTAKFRTNLTRLSNGKALSLMQLVLTNAESLADERAAVYVKNLSDKAEAFGAAMKLRSTADYTAVIERMSNKINECFGLLRKLTDALGHSTSTKVAEMAMVLDDAFRHHGNIAKLPYEDKAARLELFLQDIDEADVELLESVGVSHIVSDLKSSHKHFDNVYNERNSYRDARKAKVKEARTEALDALCDLLYYVDAVTIYGGDEYAGIMGAVSEYVIWNRPKTQQKAASQNVEPESAPAGETAPENGDAVNGTSKEEAFMEA